MVTAAANIRQSAEAFGAMNETLTLSAARNVEAAQAQLSAAQSNERVAEQFGQTGERWPEIQMALEDAARVMGSLDAKLKEQIGTMADQFTERFHGASDGLLKSVQSFQPTVEALSGVVGDAQRTVVDAIGKLNAHETVMTEMVEAAANLRS